MKQEMMASSGPLCKSFAPDCRQITMPAPHHSIFHRPNALSDAQPTASKHWRLLLGVLFVCVYVFLCSMDQLTLCCVSVVQSILPCWTHDGHPTEVLQINKQVNWFKNQLQSNPRFLQDLVVKYFKVTDIIAAC